MNIADQLSAGSSRQLTDKIAGQALHADPILEELVHLTLNGRPVISMRASWVLKVMADWEPHRILPHLEILCQTLEGKFHDGVKRHVTGILMTTPIPEQMAGRVADQCFRILTSRAMPVAVRCNAMSVLEKICKAEPDLEKELEEAIYFALEETTQPSFSSRARKTLNLLKKRKTA